MDNEIYISARKGGKKNKKKPDGKGATWSHTNTEAHALSLSVWLLTRFFMFVCRVKLWYLFLVVLVKEHNYMAAAALCREPF